MSLAQALGNVEEEAPQEGRERSSNSREDSNQEVVDVLNNTMVVEEGGEDTCDDDHDDAVDTMVQLVEDASFSFSSCLI
jgi:hypothetical protein